MAFGPDCEFDSMTECARKYRGRVADEWAYCQEIRSRTETQHCGSLADRTSLPSPALDSPGAALSARHEWELRLTALADEAMADFLVQVEAQARLALRGPVLLAASSNPFSRSNVRALWRRMTRRHPVLDVLPEAELADTAYEEVAAIVTAPSPSRAATERALASRLAYEIPSADEGEATSWQARTAMAARTYATRAYNEQALAALSAGGYRAKRWVSRRDEHTRVSHREADGQAVELHDGFRVGDTLLAFPGDESGPPAETYNCRCVVVGAGAANDGNR